MCLDLNKVLQLNLSLSGHVILNLKAQNLLKACSDRCRYTGILKIHLELLQNDFSLSRFQDWIIIFRSRNEKNKHTFMSCKFQN